MAHYRYNAETGQIEEFVPVEKNCGLQIRIKPNLAYASPIDGKAITSWAKRDYDLKANACVPYEEAKERAYDGIKNRPEPLGNDFNFQNIKDFIKD